MFLHQLDWQDKPGQECERKRQRGSCCHSLLSRDKQQQLTKEIPGCENIISSTWEACSQETVGWYFWGMNIRSKNEYCNIWDADLLGVLTWNEFYVTREQMFGGGCTVGVVMRIWSPLLTGADVSEHMVFFFKTGAQIHRSNLTVMAWKEKWQQNFLSYIQYNP